MTFLAFLAFSGIVTSLSTFFLSDDLRLLMASPGGSAAACSSRGSRGRSRQASWMVVVFVAPVLIGVGTAAARRPAYYVTALSTVVPFAVIPVAVGTGCTLPASSTCSRRGARVIS